MCSTLRLTPPMLWPYTADLQQFGVVSPSISTALWAVTLMNMSIYLYPDEIMHIFLYFSQLIVTGLLQNQ